MMMEMGIRKYGFTRGLTCLILFLFCAAVPRPKVLRIIGGAFFRRIAGKFDYFYLEAERLKAIGENDAAFDLMSRAADLDTTSAAARFFLAPYYLRMGFYEQARKDLRYAAEKYPDNYWYNVVYAQFLTAEQPSRRGHTDMDAVAGTESR